MKRGIIMEQLKLLELQKAIGRIDTINRNPQDCFFKLTEEVGELASALRKNVRYQETGELKGSVEEELFDILYYTLLMADLLDVDIEAVTREKEAMNAKKYNRPNMFE